jgi:hypothetical protein
MDATHRSAPEQSLPGALYLLACDVEKGKLGRRDVLGHVLRAAVLVELTERGCLTDADGKARAAGDRRTGDPVLDGALREIAADKPRKWKSLVERRRKETFQEVEQQLVRAGTIGVEHRTWLSDRVGVRDTALVKRLCADAVDTLHSETPVEQVPPRQAALVALAGLGNLPSVLSGRERRQYKKRLKALTERAGEAGPALKKALASLEAGRAAAISAATTGS